jgi:hypothetical protein
MSILENIVTMDELTVSFHTPKMKQYSKQGLEKGKHGWGGGGAIKVKVLAFFNCKGLIYTNYVPRGERSMPRILLRSHSIPENLKKKRLRWRPGTSGSTETSPCPNCRLDDQLMMAMQLKIIKHLPYIFSGSGSC